MALQNLIKFTLKSVKVPLDGILSLQCVDSTTQLSKQAEDTISLSMSPTKMLNLCKNAKEVKCKIIQEIATEIYAA